MARLDLDLGTERQVGGSSHTHGLKLPPHLSEPSTSDPRPPLFDATAQSSIEFDALAYLAALDAPLPTNTGWEHLPPRISDVTEMSFIVPKVMSWLAWSEIPAKEGLNGKGSPTTELDTLSSEILVTPLPPQLHLGPQGQTQEKMGAKFDCSSSLGARTPEARTPYRSARNRLGSDNRNSGATLYHLSTLSHLRGLTSDARSWLAT